MATLETIAAAIKQIDSKKEDLKKSYDDLQTHSSLLSSFSLSWSDMDAHFTHIQNSLTHRFRLLESLDSMHSQRWPQPQLDSPSQRPSASGQDPSSSNPVDSVPTQPNLELSTHSPTLPVQDPSSSNPVDSVPTQPNLELSTHSPTVPVQDPSSSNPPSLDPAESVLTTKYKSQPDPPSSSKPLIQDRVDSVVIRPVLRTLCEKMDGKGLRKYINENPKDRESIRVELPGAIRIAPEPGLMILDAMEGFYRVDNESKGDKDPELCGIRRACVLLLEVLLGINVNIDKQVRERAKSLAFEWKKKMNLDGENGLELLGLLHLVAAYGLGCEFEKNDLVELCVTVAKYRQGTLLCKAIGLGDNVQDLIQKLIDNGKQLLAVKYIFEFELTDKYPPIPLLKAYVKESERIANKVCKDGKNSLRSQNEATAKEISALKAVIKIIEDHKLESEYPKDILQKRAELLEKLKADRKRPAAVSAPKPQQQPKKLQQQPRKPQQSGNKRPRTIASVNHTPPSVAGADVTVPLFQRPHLQPAGLLAENSAAYLSTPAGPYSLVGSTSAVALHAGTSVGLYGLTGTQGVFPGTNHVASRLYSSESRMPSGYYDRSTAYGGYNLPPHYHPSHYPW